MILKLTLVASAVAAAVLVACSSGGGGREIEVVASDMGCTPASVDVAPKEKVSFKLVNNSKGERELEGVEGTKLEEIKVAAGASKAVKFTGPEEGDSKLKCYSPGGPSTIIAVGVAEGAELKADTSVTVNLKEYTVTPNVTSVDAGTIKFTATNQGTAIHEMALITVDDKGEKHEVEEIEDIAIGKTHSITAKLKAGRYQLACLIAPGEAGSTVDHYQQGMHTEFIVK